MSKKKKKKFRAELAHALAQMQKNKQTTPSITAPSTSVKTAEEFQQSIQTKKDNVVPESSEIDKNLGQIAKKDVSRIALALTVCLAILITLYVLDLKTSYINNFSGQIIKIMHIGGKN